MLLRVAQSPAKLNSQQKEGVGMRIVFMGTPAFAATILDQLVQAYDVVGVFTQPDAVRSRGKKLEPSPVKQTALSHPLLGNDTFLFFFLGCPFIPLDSNG